MKKRILSVLLILIMSLGYSLQVYATTAEEVREEQEETEEQLNELNEQMENMEGQRERLPSLIPSWLISLPVSVSAKMKLQQKKTK